MEDGERLDVRVVRDFGLSRRKAQEAIGAGQVDVSRARIRDAGHRVLSTDVVEYHQNRRKEEVIRFSVPFAYRDDELIVVDKPAGLLSVPTDGSPRDDSVMERLRRDLAAVRGARAYVGALHRLDRGTSGLIAMALSKECHARGRAGFRGHGFYRAYQALVEGSPGRDSGTIDLPIADEYDSGRRHIARDDDEPSRRAITHFRVIERYRRAALLELELETGRQHQIRLHLRAIGHPIVGDGVYGRNEHANSRPLLHAAKLRFPHPMTGARVDCASEPPRDFAEAIRRLRR